MNYKKKRNSLKKLSHTHIQAFILILSGVFLVNAQVEAKFNAASAALLVPNFGLEFQVGERTSIQLDVSGVFKDEFKGNPLHFTQSFGEFRYYKNQHNLGWFVGGHIGFGMFMLQKPKFVIIYDHYDTPENYDTRENSFSTGRIWFYGLTLGYKKALNERWSLEGFVGGGLTQAWYKAYFNGIEQPDSKGRPFNGSGEVVVYRGGLMVVYKIFPYQKKSVTQWRFKF